ncbi:hypothetical protein HU200_031208 [Digitaria exilis]|uniref:Uncharacterized protein n=1 Tax=Digitaria exilis TaxID=1010633 RepID=A0A835BVX4_9POAL|nr:hypothetical protein HU200_031208 [Digitaria exilis]
MGEEQNLQTKKDEKATTTTTTTLLTMKLLVDTKSQRVLFAEAGKDVVDFLLSILALPVVTAVKLLGEDAMVGCVGSLYASVDKLDATCLLPGVPKGALLRPTVASPAVYGSGAGASLLLSALEPAPEQQQQQPKSFFKYSYQLDRCHDYVTDVRGASCPICHHPMSYELRYVEPVAELDDVLVDKKVEEEDETAAAAAKGFVQGQGVVMYTVTDDLAVSPMSAIATLRTFALTTDDLAALEEMTVQLGHAEVTR